MRGYGVRIQRIEAYSADVKSEWHVVRTGAQWSDRSVKSSSIGDDRWYSAVGVEWCGFATLETRPGQRRLDAEIAARRAVCTRHGDGPGLWWSYMW